MNHYQQLFNLKDRVAIVTGGAGILGAAFCKALCAAGAKVACIDIQQEALTKLMQELHHEYSAQAVVGFVCDVANTQSVKETINAIIKKFSRIDILLNNAATKTNELSNFFKPFSDYSLAVWREIMAVNLDGMFLMAQAVGKQMLQQQQGVIVQTGSIYSFNAPDPRIYAGSDYLGHEINTPAVYTASKAGVIGLTKHLATLWAEHGIRVNALCPGGITSGQNQAFDKKYSARVPMGRMATEMDIVGPMLFLVSNAASYMTGQVLYIDGGLSAW